MSSQYSKKSVQFLPPVLYETFTVHDVGRQSNGLLRQRWDRKAFVLLNLLKRRIETLEIIEPSIYNVCFVLVVHADES